MIILFIFSIISSIYTLVESERFYNCDSQRVLIETTSYTIEITVMFLILLVEHATFSRDILVKNFNNTR